MPQQHQRALQEMQAYQQKRQQPAAPAPPPKAPTAAPPSSIFDQAVKAGQSGLEFLFGPSILTGNMPNPYSPDASERARFWNALAMQAAPSPLAVGIRPGGSVPQRVADLLHNTQLDPLKWRMPEEPLQPGKPYNPKGLWNAQGELYSINNLQKLLERHFTPAELPEAMNYLHAVDAWKTGYTGYIRDAMAGTNQYAQDQILAGRLTPKDVADRLVDLFGASNYKAPGTLYRYSTFMGEFPKMRATPGETFHLNPTSWSASPDWARTSSWKMPKGPYATPLLMMEPSAKTLPMGGVLGFPDQFEHFVTGNVRVLDASPKFVRMQQLDPSIIPMP